VTGNHAIPASRAGLGPNYGGDARQGFERIFRPDGATTVVLAAVIASFLLYSAG
jgi:hypothetical protein